MVYGEWVVQNNNNRNSEKTTHENPRTFFPDLPRLAADLLWRGRIPVLRLSGFTDRLIGPNRHRRHFPYAGVAG